MCIENNLGIHATRATHATLLGRLRQRRTGKSNDIQDCCAPTPATEPESTEELSRHSVVPLTDDRQVVREIRPPLFSAADLAGKEPCPYTPDQLTAFTISRPHLTCCPATTPHPWNWRERAWCGTRCETPCGRADDAAEHKRIIQ
jgi:hypothetical protein